MQLALRSGIATGTALGFLWALGGAAERRGQYRLSVALGNVALRLAERYGGSAEKWYVRAFSNCPRYSSLS